MSLFIADKNDEFVYFKNRGSVIARVLLVVLAVMCTYFIFVHGLPSQAMSLEVEVAIGVFILSVVAFCYLGYKDDKHALEVKAGFSQWAVMNHGLTPLEFMDTNKQTQKFLDSDANEVTRTLRFKDADYQSKKAVFVSFSSESINDQNTVENV